MEPRANTEARDSMTPLAKGEGHAGFCLSCMRPLAGATTCPLCGMDAHPHNQTHQLPAGTVLHGGDYIAGRALGQGGFGITYIGRDLVLDRRVAIKEFYPLGFASRNAESTRDVTVTDDGRRRFVEGGKNRFLDEARVLAQFQDVPGIVKVLAYFEENQTAYIVMEFLEGETLRSVVDRSPLEPADLLPATTPILDALEQVHAKGLVHRDISPDNIMVLADGSLRLMDFGAARLIDYNDQRSVSIVLKAGYAPEEQYRPKGEQGPWTDVYALCATLYKALTGKTPEDALQRTFKDDMKWPSELGKPMPKGLEKALQHGMALKASDRYQSIAELRAALDASIDLDAKAPEPKKRPRPRAIVAVALACALVAAVAVGAVALGSPSIAGDLFGREEPAHGSLKIPALYRIDFDSSGGSEVQPAFAFAGSQVQAPDKPKRKNYKFKGWYFNKKLTKKVSFPFEPTQDATLHAKWAEVLTSYTVRYVQDVNGEQTDVPNAETRVVDKQHIGAKITEDAPSIDGYDLVSEPSQTITLAKDAADNVVTFTYAVHYEPVVYYGGSSGSSGSRSGGDSGSKTGGSSSSKGYTITI